MSETDNEVFLKMFRDYFFIYLHSRNHYYLRISKIVYR